MPSLVPFRGSSNLPTQYRPGSPARQRPQKPPLAVRSPNLLQGTAVVGSSLPKLFAAVVYASLAVAAFVFRAALPAFAIEGIAFPFWLIAGLVAIMLWELVPFLFAIIGFRMRANAEAWERQQIHEAQTYGDARQANWMETHDALRGRAAPSPAESWEFDE